MEKIDKISSRRPRIVFAFLVAFLAAVGIFMWASEMKHDDQPKVLTKPPQTDLNDKRDIK